MEAIKNIKMVEFARNEARGLIEQDKTLSHYPELKKIVETKDFELHFE
jgi:hypothetical protein